MGFFPLLAFACCWNFSFNALGFGPRFCDVLVGAIALRSQSGGSAFAGGFGFALAFAGGLAFGLFFEPFGLPMCSSDNLVAATPQEVLALGPL
jgi:hypothetical protein